MVSDNSLPNPFIAIMTLGHLKMLTSSNRSHRHFMTSIATTSETAETAAALSAVRVTNGSLSIYSLVTSLFAVKCGEVAVNCGDRRLEAPRFEKGLQLIAPAATQF